MKLIHQNLVYQCAGLDDTNSDVRLVFDGLDLHIL